MIDSNKKLKRLQLSDALQAYPSPEAAMPPRGGWVRAIREALGMTQAQLATVQPIAAGSVALLRHQAFDFSERCLVFAFCPDGFVAHLYALHSNKA